MLYNIKICDGMFGVERIYRETQQSPHISSYIYSIFLKRRKKNRNILFLLFRVQIFVHTQPQFTINTYILLCICIFCGMFNIMGL